MIRIALFALQQDVGALPPQTRVHGARPFTGHRIDMLDIERRDVR
jgi:hypothetical protein